MALVGSTIIQHFRVHDSADANVLGLNTASFTFTAYSAGAAVTWAPTVAEISNGVYSLSYALPAATTDFTRFVVPVSTSNLVQWGDMAGEIESTDLATIQASVVRPVATVGADFTPQGELQITYISGDTRSIIISIADSSGNAIDIQNDYGSYGFGIRSQDGTSSITAITTATAVIGTVTIPVLVGDTFQSYISDGEDTTRMRWDFQATKTSDSSINTLARGDFVLKRQEYRA